jgi:hypothetical protein
MGLAIYFVLNGRPLAVACDCFDSAAANMRLPGLAIEAARQPERHGIAAWDLSRWDDPDGGVTLDTDHTVNLVHVIRGAADFLRQKGPRGATQQRGWRADRRPRARELTRSERAYRGRRDPLGASARPLFAVPRHRRPVGSRGKTT